MKILTAILALTFFVPAAFACNGGHIKTLAIGEREIAQIDMSINRVKITDPNSELFYVAHTPSGREISQMICGSPNSGEEICDFDQGLKLNLFDDPDASLVVGVLVDTHKETYFNVTNFRQARSRCGGVVQGESN